MGRLAQVNCPVAQPWVATAASQGSPFLPGHFPTPWSSPTGVLAAEEKEEPRWQRNWRASLTGTGWGLPQTLGTHSLGVDLSATTSCLYNCKYVITESLWTSVSPSATWG